VSEPDAQRLSDRVSQSLLGVIDVFSIYLGDRLGFYRALAADGAMTSLVLAERTETTERYVREWLEQQAISDILRCENPADAVEARRFALPEAYRPLLADAESGQSATNWVRDFVGCLKPLPQLIEAFRTGAGIPYDAYGDDVREGQAASGKAKYRQKLGREWIAAMPDVFAQLMSDHPARVADIGMGYGWSSIAIAETFPNVLVDGFDLDPKSVEQATHNAAASNVGDRVHFQIRDASNPELAGHYDLAVAIECIHDMSNPVAALRALRGLVGENGTVFVVDQRVAETFSPPGDDGERSKYGYSVFHCLPISMVDQPSAATGTVIRESTMRRYAEQAGFRSIDVLPIEDDTFRFYRMMG
jgi:2-polyprenyl-3-methyl-5-hydroxy-6-metoxy-1,4-benzoquinol methylase